jgi:hypothetical protein
VTDTTPHTGKTEMAIYTTTANGTLSTQQLDVMFTEVQAMPTKDVYGRPDALKTAMMYEALHEFWHFRNLAFGDGEGMKSEAKNKAAKWYRKHADEMEALK